MAAWGRGQGGEEESRPDSVCGGGAAAVSARGTAARELGRLGWASAQSGAGVFFKIISPNRKKI